MIVADTQNALDSVLEVLYPFLPLVNSHMVDFLSCDLWNMHIPIDIRTEVNELGIDNAVILTKGNVNYRKDCQSPIKQFLLNAKNVSSLGIKRAEDLWSSLESLGGEVKKSDPQLTMFMSSKKAHEVQVLSRVIASLARINDTGCIIDLGGGKGYLGSTLVYHYGLKVLSVDCAQVNTHGAVKLANNLKKWWDVMQEDSSLGGSQDVENQYKQTTSFINLETNLVELVQEHFKMGAQNGRTNLQNLCLVGLHACGDLTPSCIQLFCTNSDIKALCIVGCCYNLITEDTGETTSEMPRETGFPMSQYLKKKGIKLGRNARMLAAQSVDRINESDRPPSVSLWYRALLQMLLIERKENTDLQVGRSKASIKDFSEYVSNALTKLKLPQATPEEVHKIETQYQKWQKFHTIFFMMRVSLAPVIETLILLDRILFLQEQEFEHTHLVQLFDSVISPRCCGIIAFKK